MCFPSKITANITRNKRQMKKHNRDWKQESRERKEDKVKEKVRNEINFNHFLLYFVKVRSHAMLQYIQSYIQLSVFSKLPSGLMSFRTIKTTLTAKRHNISSFYKNCHKILIKMHLKITACLLT